MMPISGDSPRMQRIVALRSSEYERALQRATTTDIMVWFDPNRREHLDAWIYYIRHKTWPEGFLPSHIQLESGWYENLSILVANIAADGITSDP